MAQGDVTFFQPFIGLLGDGDHDLDADVIRLAIIDSVQTPSGSTEADPRWAAGGDVNFDTNEVTQTGNYTLEGLDIAATWSETGGTGTFDATDVTTWTQNAANPDDARWLIGYNDTNANNSCIFFVDLGSIFDMTTGDLNVTWNASGILTIA